MKNPFVQNAGFWLLSCVMLFGLSGLVSCGVKNLNDMERFLSGQEKTNYEEEPHDSEWPTEEQLTYGQVKGWG